MEPFLGQLLLASFNFTPRGFLPANGQVLPIQQYTALFALFGTFFGGNGQSNFALPDLRGRVPIHQGTSLQGNTFTMGEAGGAESHTISAPETPQHNHLVTANKTANQTDPSSAFLGGNAAAAFQFAGKCRNNESKCHFQRRRISASRKPAAFPGDELGRCDVRHLSLSELKQV